MSEQAVSGIPPTTTLPTRSARRRLARWGVGGAVLLILPVWLGWRPVARAVPGWLSERSDPRAADAIVVLAGDQSGARVDRGVELYRAGLLAEGPFIVSGGQLYSTVTWASLMAQRAKEAGVPAERIVLQDRSTTTAGDARFTRDELLKRNTKRVILVTSSWHSGRAARIFRRELGDEFEVISCPLEDTTRQDWWNDPVTTRALTTEILKRLWPGPGS